MLGLEARVGHFTPGRYQSSCNLHPLGLSILVLGPRSSRLDWVECVLWASLDSSPGGGLSIFLIFPTLWVRQERPEEMLLLGVSAQTAFAAKYVKAFGLWFSA